MTAASGDGQAGTMSLLAEITAGLGRLVRGELSLARAEAAEGLKAAGSGLVKIAVAAVLVFSPFTQRSEISFLLAKDKVEMAQERMKVTRAEYRGQDTKGQPFALVAGSAVQKSSAEPIVRMTDLSGAIRLDDGPATIVAKQSAYNMDTEKVDVPGLVQVRSANGYRIDASNVAVDLGQLQTRLEVGNRQANLPRQLEAVVAAVGIQAAPIGDAVVDHTRWRGPCE